MIYYYGSEISPNKTETVEGFLICRNVPIARTGEQIYIARELMLDGDPDRAVKVNRYEADVFDRAVLASFEGKPVTDGHPSENVSPENFSSYAKGHVQNVRRDGDFIVADLYINDAVLISEIQNGVKREVSCGYLCNYDADGINYKQTHIRGNHVAVVPMGRAGHEVAIKDAAATAVEKGGIMSKFLREVLTAFGNTAKDAKPEELEELVETTAGALEKAETQEAEPVEETQDAEPVKEEEPKEEKPEEDPKEEPEEEPKEAPAEDEAPDLKAMVDALTERIAALEKGEGKQKEEVELSDEEKIDQAIDSLGEESTVIEADEACEGLGKDAAITVLKTMRPVVAKISNKAERAAVADALLSMVHDSKMGDIFAASKESAQKAADSSAKTTYEKRCEESSNAYSARNPHKKED